MKKALLLWLLMTTPVFAVDPNPSLNPMAKVRIQDEITADQAVLDTLEDIFMQESRVLIFSDAKLQRMLALATQMASLEAKIQNLKDQLASL